MTHIEKTGTSLEQVIRSFKQEYKIMDWELKYEVIKKPRAGFLGLFASKKAVVRFELPSIEERVAVFYENLLRKIGIMYDSLDVKKEGKTIHVEVKGCKESGFLIGKNGSMLETLQFFSNRVFEDEKSLDRIYLDANGYRDRKEATFLKKYLPQIKSAKDKGKPVTLEPMNASDRRMIHRFVEKDRELKTLTLGEGEMKRIVVFSAKQSEKEVLSQTPQKPVRKSHPKPKPRQRKKQSDTNQNS